MNSETKSQLDLKSSMLSDTPASNSIQKFDNLNDVLQCLSPKTRINVQIKGSFSIIFALLSFWALVIFSILFYKLLIIQTIELQIVNNQFDTNTTNLMKISLLGQSCVQLLDLFVNLDKNNKFAFQFHHFGVQLACINMMQKDNFSISLACLGLFQQLSGAPTWWLLTLSQCCIDSKVLKRWKNYSLISLAVCQLGAFGFQVIMVFEAQMQGNYMFMVTQTIMFTIWDIQDVQLYLFVRNLNVLRVVDKVIEAIRSDLSKKDLVVKVIN